MEMKTAIFRECLSDVRYGFHERISFAPHYTIGFNPQMLCRVAVLMLLRAPQPSARDFRHAFEVHIRRLH
jgi:hypothetical protein